MTQADLPLPDDDALSAGSIESRIRSLDVAELRRVLAYEQEHADRPQVVLVLEHRLTALETDEAEPVPGDPMAPLPS